MARKFERRLILQTPVRRELRATLADVMDARKLVAVVFGSSAVVAFLAFALIVYFRDLPPTDNPAVMTGAPAPVLNAPRPEPITTTGQAVESADGVSTERR